MQTVPSLVGTGAAIAAAASGLVFGQATESDPAPTRRGLCQRTSSAHQALDPNHHPIGLTPARPATTSAAPSECPYHYTIAHPQSASRPPLSRHQRPWSSQFTSPRPPGKGPLLARPHELALSAVAGAPRDSLTSNGSWMKRLSIRPLSQHGSANSSLIADSTSLTFSHSSAAPILARPGPTAPPLPPNKLVKRLSSTQNQPPGDVPRWRSKGHRPTLRRPATSHQRSATLQQFRADIDVARSTLHPRYSFDQPIGPEELLGASPSGRLVPEPQPNLAWTSFFHSKTASIAASGSIQSRLGDASPSARNSSFKRICPGGDRRQRVHQVKPRMVSASVAPSRVPPTAPPDIEKKPDRTTTVLGYPPVSLETAPPTRTRRSLSATFSSAGNWVSKTSGSLRSPKRGTDCRGDSTSQWHISNTVSGMQFVDQRRENDMPEKSISNTPVAADKQRFTSDSAATFLPHQRPVRARNRSSPQPPLSGPGGAVTLYQARPNQPSGGSSTSSAAMSHLVRGSHYERSSVMESSDGDARGFTSGDDDDLDFKSDTVFDSLRTLASGRARAVETPLESVYDESPPSTAGNGKVRRLSTPDVLARGWEGDDRIMEEEDENAMAPVRGAKHAGMRVSTYDVLAAEPRLGSRNDDTQPARDFGHLSLNDDEDWTRDDKVSFNPVSAPSKTSSLTPKAINPNVRLALASIEGGRSLPRTGGHAHRIERPLSNLFDWSENSVHDKQDNGSVSMRLWTAYAKPEMDSRGGRSAIRKGPIPTHVRSQSVPIVHDSADDSKTAGSKYSTWGVSSKTVSEDWDEDFEFGSGNAEADGKCDGGVFAVPESIRATQPSVKAHSGQIRELSLLVNDLKRLCRHGRELKMLSGEQKGLWREAEGIIALASPDEDEVDEDPKSASPISLDAFDIGHEPLDDGYEVASLDRLDVAIGNQEAAMSRMAVVRERQSPRRRSVFSPDDGIFGGSWPSDEGDAQPLRGSRPRTPDNRASRPNDVTGVVRSVMEAVHHRSSTEPTDEPRHTHDNDSNSKRVHFDTNSLKALVRRAGELRDVLSDAIRRADQITQSPARTPPPPRHERRLETSPAFTRVFDDPGSTPRRTIQTESMMESASSPNKSPSSPMGRRTPMMTVN